MVLLTLSTLFFILAVYTARKAYLLQLKEIEPDGLLSVLVITAQPEHKLRALKAGARDFVSKPFDLSEVLMRVHNMLELRLLQDRKSVV